MHIQREDFLCTPEKGGPICSSGRRAPPFLLQACHSLSSFLGLCGIYTTICLFLHREEEGRRRSRVREGRKASTVVAARECV